MAMSDARLAQTIKAMFDAFEQQAQSGATSEEMKQAISLEFAQKLIAEVRQMTITGTAGANPITITNIQ